MQIANTNTLASNETLLAKKRVVSKQNSTFETELVGFAVQQHEIDLQIHDSQAGVVSFVLTQQIQRNSNKYKAIPFHR